LQTPSACVPSIGSSLIWDSPFGALPVDYANPISKANADVTQRLHFGVGAFLNLWLPDGYAGQARV